MTYESRELQNMLWKFGQDFIGVSQSVLEIKEQLQNYEPELIIIQANYELFTTKLSVLDS